MRQRAKRTAAVVMAALAFAQAFPFSLLVYNDAGDLTLINYPTGTDTSFTYDGAGRTDSMVDATGTSEWTFNAAGEVTLLETPQGDIAYAYNAAGQVVEMEVDGTDLTEYSYDAYGRFSSLTNPFSETTSVTYDSAGRVDRKDFDSGVYETFVYDDRSRPELVLVKNSGNTEIDRKEYVWDAASRVTSAKEGGVWSYYEYDAIDQLTEEEKPALSYLANYTYDANGNRLTRTVNSVTECYVYDEADKLETVSVNSSVVKEFTYDAAGRTTAIETGTGVTSLSYDYEGRVTGITYPNTSSDGFAYNGIGARTSTSGTNGSRTFLRAGLGVTSPVLSDGTADYTPGVSRREGSTTKFSHSGLKNANSQTNSSEAVTGSRVYDAFGNVISSSGSWSGPYGYGGGFGYQEDANGLALLGHRYTDGSTGRFLTRDPKREGRHWYVYVNGNPLSRVDPDGCMLIPLATYMIASDEDGWKYAPPLYPPGESVIRNIRLTLDDVAEQDRLNEIGMRFGRMMLFRPEMAWKERQGGGGVWDYKLYNSKNLEVYDDAGNFNYGATGAALGYSLKFLLLGGDLDSLKDYGEWPDQEDDRFWIRRGYLYYHHVYEHQ